MNCFTFFLVFPTKTKSPFGGDGYTAPVAKINDEIHYLHRDYLGSILAISDSSGRVLEERQFGAWGEVDFFKIHGQESDFSDSILARGFTGHEHFSEIALIHMNGRMYDPQLRRFLSPDNNIINPFDTRSFDRMAYVFHNPLMNVDLNGEEPLMAFLLSLAIKAVIAFAVSYVVSGVEHVIDTGQWEWNPFRRVSYFGIKVDANIDHLLSNGGSLRTNLRDNSNTEGSNVDVNPANFSNTNSGFGSLSQEMSNNSETTTTGPCDIFTSPENCFQFGNNENNTENNQENVVITVATSVQNPNPVGGGGNSDGENEEEDNYELCNGDPLAKMEITSSGASGKEGGTFGCTRNGDICEGIAGKKNHDGLDLTADKNTNVFATHSGKVHSIRDTFTSGQYEENSYGNFVIIETKINDKIHFVKFNHLNEVLVSKDDIVNIGDIIGLSGNTGNANPPPPQTPPIPHVHIQVFDSNWGSLNPIDFIHSEFDENFDLIENNCN